MMCNFLISMKLPLCQHLMFPYFLFVLIDIFSKRFSLSGLKINTVVLKLSEKSFSISLRNHFIHLYLYFSYISLSKMASRSNLGMENQLNIIIKRLVGFEE